MGEAFQPASHLGGWKSGLSRPGHVNRRTSRPIPRGGAVATAPGSLAVLEGESVNSSWPHRGGLIWPRLGSVFDVEPAAGGAVASEDESIEQEDGKQGNAEQR